MKARLRGIIRKVTRPSESTAHLFVGLNFQVLVWQSFFSQAAGVPHSHQLTLILSTGAIISIGGVIILAKRSETTSLTLWVFVISAFGTLMAYFSTLYLSYGSTVNFTMRLTRFDALYFTVGTLAGGTGNIVAISDTARRIQTIQMALDIGLVLFAVGVAVNRFSAGWAQKLSGGDEVRESPVKKPAEGQAKQGQPHKGGSRKLADKQASSKRDEQGSNRGLMLRTFGVCSMSLYSLKVFFMPTTDYSISPLYVAGLVAATVGTIALIFGGLRFKFKSLELFAYIGQAFVMLVVNFAILYSSKGTVGNFNVRLTRLDALYFSLGTLSSAGSGNITATSTIIREFQIVQVVLGLILVLFAVGIAMNRLSALSPQEADAATQEGEVSDKARDGRPKGPGRASPSKRTPRHKRRRR